jgi:signal transduction histidine kinase/ActR/RegA family two-component response regulator
MTGRRTARAQREAEALARSARLLTETLDMTTVGRRVVEIVCGLFEVPAAGLRLREADGSLVLVAASSDDGPYMPTGHRAAPGFGFYPLVVDAGRPLRIPDLLDEAAATLPDEMLERVRASGVRSLLAVPLRVQQRTTGVLSLGAAIGRVFSDDEAALLQAFADQAALALENSRSHAEVVRQRQAAEELARVAGLVSETLDLVTVGERIVGGVLGLLDVESSALRLLGPGGALTAVALGGRAKAYAGSRAVVPLGVGLIGSAAAEGRPMWTADFRTDDRFSTSPEIRDRNLAVGIVAGLAVPLRVAGKVTGVLSVGSPAPRAFADRDIALLQAFADQAAIAINNAQTQEALAKQAERLRILHEIDRALIAEQAPVAIAEAVVFPLRDLLEVPRVIVNLFDMAAGQVEWLAAAGRRRQHLGPRVRYSLRLAGDLEALRRGEPQTIDVHALRPDPAAEALLAAGLHVYMVVPMIAGGELIGSISVCDEAGPFTPEIVGIAQEVATQLGIAIAQARLHERVTRQAAELERRVEERTRELTDATAEADRANRAKSEFLSRMSHELRTPLNAILGFAQLLEMKALPARERESVGHILRAGRHLLGLINEVLDISRIEAGRLQLSLEPVPVGHTLAQAVELVRPTASGLGVSVLVDDIDGTLHVLADRQRLQQVFLNLLSNAIKYNRPRGTVRIACEPVPEDRVRIAVTDTGRGIAADKLARLFVPFDRLGAEAGGVEGTGLGLTLSKSLVDAMNGALRVQSEPGTGSTFSVELRAVPPPAAAAGAAGAPAEAVEGQALERPRTILYIEDNLSNVRLVESILGLRPGVTVLSAMQGRVGVDLACSHRPDLVLLDRHLPDISGEEVFRLLREDPRTRAIPVVMLSADAIVGGMQPLLEAGVRAYLTKPLDVRRLLAVIDEHLREPEDGRP